MFCEGNNEVSFRSIVRYFRKRKKKERKQRKTITLHRHISSWRKRMSSSFFFFVFFTLYRADVRRTRARQQHEDFSIQLRDRDVLSFEEILLLRSISPPRENVDRTCSGQISKANEIMIIA